MSAGARCLAPVVPLLQDIPTSTYEPVITEKQLSFAYRDPSVKDIELLLHDDVQENNATAAATANATPVPVSKPVSLANATDTVPSAPQAIAAAGGTVNTSGGDAGLAGTDPRLNAIAYTGVPSYFSRPSSHVVATDAPGTQCALISVLPFFVFVLFFLCLSCLVHSYV